jgi:hypothetical protein
MKRALIAAAAGAIGALGTTGLMSAAPASAAPCTATTPPFTPARVACVAAEQTGTFVQSIDPVANLNTFFNGAPDDTPFGSLGVVHQPETFVNSIVGPGGFLDGPRSPE